MHEITSQDDYDEMVRGLTDELADEMADGEKIIESIAKQVIVGIRIKHGKPVVQQTAIYEGGALETLETCLRPTDVLTYTHTENLTAPPAGQTPNIWEQAVDALTADLNRAYRKHAEAAQHG